MGTDLLNFSCETILSNGSYLANYSFSLFELGKKSDSHSDHCFFRKDTFVYFRVTLSGKQVSLGDAS